MQLITWCAINFLTEYVLPLSPLYLSDGNTVNPIMLSKNYVPINHIRHHNFTLGHNGFQVLQFNQLDMLSSLKRLQNNNIANNRYQHRQLVEKYISQLLNMDVSKVIAVDSVYRNTSQSVFKNIPLTHIDFNDQDSDETIFDYFSDQWYPKLTHKIGSIDKKSFWKQHKISKILILWMPLNDILTSHPLAVMDTQTIQTNSVVPYIASRRKVTGNKNRENSFTAKALKYDSTGKWYFKENMKLGEGYLMNAKKTPHSSVDNFVPGNRKSIECRIVVLE